MTKPFSLLEEKGFREPALFPAMHCCWLRHKTLPFCLFPASPLHFPLCSAHCPPQLPTGLISQHTSSFRSPPFPDQMRPHSSFPDRLLHLCGEKMADLQRPAFPVCIPPVDKRRDVLLWRHAPGTPVHLISGLEGCMVSLCLKTKAKNILEKRNILNLSPFLCRN